MKKILLAICFISIAVNAQEQLKISPKAGVNFSTLSNVSKGKMLPGYYIGASAEIKLTEKFSFQPELIYSSQGVKNVYSETIASVTSHHHNHDKMEYINLPLLAKYYFMKGFSIEMGPQFGILLKAINKDEITTNDVKIKRDKKFTDEVNSFDFGIGAGLAYDILPNFFINARYNLGLTNVGKSNEYYDGSKNRVTQFGLGYKF